MTLNKINWRRFKSVQRVHRVMYALGLGPIVGRIILLLTTTGRKSGRRYVTPLQYEEVDGTYVVGSARGQQSDWFKNLQVNPQVEVQVKNKRFKAKANVITDPQQIVAFLERRLRNHPRMMGMMMRLHDLPAKPTRDQLETLAKDQAIVVLIPVDKQ